MGRAAAVFLLALLTAEAFSASQVGQQSVESGLLARIEEARTLVRDERVQLLKGVVGTRRVRVGRRRFKEVPIIGNVGREVALAVLDSKGNLSVGRAIKRDEGLELLSPGFVIAVRRENGINSDFQCIQPHGGKVLAIKYPVSNENARFGPYGAVIEAVYTPYSADIKTEEVVQRGAETVETLVGAAYARLRERGVYSRAFLGRPVVDVIPPHLLTVLLMNEHIDPGEFTTEAKTKQLVERVLSVIATNGKDAYAYSISPAGARVLVQMIPSTYALLLNRYPLARLNPNFSTAMTDPINAVMAQVLLCDSDWQTIREERNDIPVERIGPYLAAAYNGGVRRVLSVLRNDGQDWMEAPEENRKPTMTVAQRVRVRVRQRGRVRTVYVTKHYTRPVFRSETTKYVSQYHWIDNFLSARSNRQLNSPIPQVEQ